MVLSSIYPAVHLPKAQPDYCYCTSKRKNEERAYCWKLHILFPILPDQTCRFFGLLLQARLASFLRQLWLDRKHIVLRRYGTFFAQQAQAVTAVVQQCGRLGHVLRHDTNLGEKTEDEGLRLAEPGVSGPQVPAQALKVAPPWECVGAIPARALRVFGGKNQRALAHSLSPYAMKSKCSFTSKPAFARAT